MTASNPYPLETLAQHQELCATEIGQRLESGSLALVLGAGVSVGMGLPAWWELVKGCVEKAKLTIEVNEKTEPSKLKQIMDRVEDTFPNPDEYHNVVRDCLYVTAKDDEAILDQRLLAVLGAMTMKSRRGSVSEVLTYNFDDILERYLRLHGFTSQAVLSLPDLRRDVDVTVDHPHGFLASPRMAADDSLDIVLSKYSYEKFEGQRLNPWQELLRDMVARKFVLFVGLSGDGPLMNVLTDVQPKISACRGATGFWLLGPGDDPESEKDLLKRNVVPVRLKEYDDYYRFLLGVCQQAASIHNRL